MSTHRTYKTGTLATVHLQMFINLITLSSDTGSQLRSWEGMKELFPLPLFTHAGSTTVLALLVDEVNIKHKPTT